MDTPDEGRFAKSRKIGRVSHDGEIGVAAKLGRAVEYVRLPAHEQRADAVLLHRRIAAERGVALGWPAFSLRGDYFLLSGGQPMRAL